MALKHQYDKQEDIPEAHRELFSERNGKWELTGVTGIQTQANVDRLERTLANERAATKDAKDKLAEWTALGESPDDVRKRLDEIDELELKAKGKPDQAELDELRGKWEKRAKAPLELEISRLTKERDELKASNEEHIGRDRQRKIHDAIRSAATEAKLRPEAIDDALVLGERIFDVAEDGSVVTKDQVGVAPGLQPKDWLGEIRDRRPHWWPGSIGTGAPGSGGRGGFPAGADNPWSAAGWNLTKQGSYVREHGLEKAEAMAKAAGTQFGGGPPKPAQQGAAGQ